MKVSKTKNDINTRSPVLGTFSERPSNDMICHQMEKVEDPNLRVLFDQYSDIFAKNKYDVGKIKIEPQQVRLTDFFKSI